MIWPCKYASKDSHSSSLEMDSDPDWLKSMKSSIALFYKFMKYILYYFNNIINYILINLTNLLLINLFYFILF